MATVLNAVGMESNPAYSICGRHELRRDTSGLDASTKRSVLKMDSKKARKSKLKPRFKLAPLKIQGKSYYLILPKFVKFDKEKKQ